MHSGTTAVFSIVIVFKCYVFVSSLFLNAVLAIYFTSVPDQDKGNGQIDTLKYPPSLGITLEFCAGIVDKSKSLAETAKEEVLEECGYDVPVEILHRFKTARCVQILRLSPKSLSLYLFIFTFIVCVCIGLGFQLKELTKPSFMLKLLII